MKHVLAVLLMLGAAAGLPAQTLRFFVGEWMPYTGATAAGNGAAAQLVAAACQAAGLTASFEFGPWKRAEAAVADGAAFATFPYAETPERQERFLFSDPLFLSSFAVLLRADNPATTGFRFTSTEAFRNFRVGVTSGTDAVRLPLQKAGALVEETTTVDQSVKKLELGRLDFVIDDRAVLAGCLKDGARPGLVLLDKRFGDRMAFRLMVSRKWPGAEALVQRFNAGLAQVRSQDRLSPP